MLTMPNTSCKNAGSPVRAVGERLGVLLGSLFFTKHSHGYFSFQIKEAFGIFTWPPAAWDEVRID